MSFLFSQCHLFIRCLIFNCLNFQEDEQLPADDSDVDCDEIPESVLARYSQSQDHLDETGTDVAASTIIQSTVIIPRTKAIPSTKIRTKSAKPQNVEDDDGDDDDDEEASDTECITFTAAVNEIHDVSKKT